MIKQLVSLQFIFLFCPIYILSLVVFGSDFRGMTGGFYVAALLLITLLHFSKHYWVEMLTKSFKQVILIISVVVGLIAYRQLHFNVWDEHSVSQAILFSVFAVLSYFCSVIAMYAEDETTKYDIYVLPKILLIFAFCWLFALVYPHSLFFFVALFLGIALINLSWSQSWTLQSSKIYLNEKLGWERYLVFVLTLDTALVIWDYKVNSLWAVYIAVSFIAAAIGVILAKFLPREIKPWVVALLMLNLLLAVIFPTYILNVLHNMLSGLGVGLLMVWSFRKQPITFYQKMSDHWPYVILGLSLSYLFYAHLSLAYWRSIFVIPFLYLGTKQVLKVYK